MAVMDSRASVRDAVPLDLAERARREFVSASWKHEVFSNHGHFSTPDYARGVSGIPTKDETYTTEFYKSTQLATSEFMMGCVWHIADAIDSQLAGEDTRVNRNNVNLLAYKLTPGCHLRLHNDKYAADAGFIWYLSRDWKWDWGGLLLTVADDGSASVEMPEFNKLVILNHGSGAIHCVTSVEKWARDDRYILIGMMRLAKKE
jgi:Rps23 Pro-64 3,4-dihydroxylase Tpa1-like proline 4-hydroxylase